VPGKRSKIVEVGLAHRIAPAPSQEAGGLGRVQKEAIAMRRERCDHLRALPPAPGPAVVAFNDAEIDGQ
jgi:hypothetical protein